MNAVNDIVDDDLSIGDAFRKRGNESLRNLKRRAVEKMSGEGLTTSRKKSKIHSSLGSGDSKKPKSTAKKPAAKKEKSKVVKKTKPTKVTKSIKKKKKKDDSSAEEFDFF